MNKVTKPSHLTTLNGDLLRRANLFSFIREFIQAQGMPEGYYMEFGILNGEALIDAYRQLRGVVSHYFGFDSFEGLPDLHDSDEKARKFCPHFFKGNFKSMAMDYVMENIISSCRIGEEELTLIKGYFSDVLPKLDKAAMHERGVPLCIYIDCDLYSSTVDVLKFIGDLVVTGTWILFDDYWAYRGSPLHGEQKAIQEWVNGHDRIGLSGYCNFNGFGRAFIAYEKQ